MTTFNDLHLSEDILDALNDLNFEKPTPVQEAAIPPALKGLDLIASAETGSGKTAAFCVPIFSRLLDDPKQRALILAPTRELAFQISDFMRQLTADHRHIKTTSLVGGADIRKQMKALRGNPQVIVATPGRLSDHIKRRSVCLKNTSVLVLDEGDRMLDIGFAPQLDFILQYLPKKRQSSLFSATFPDKLKKLASKYLNNPEKISVGRSSLPVEAIKQSVVQVNSEEKKERIIDELNRREGSIIVFTRTKRRTDGLARHLLKVGFSVDLIHGGRSQGQRNRALRNFKKGESRILCATDVAARGIDIPLVEHVINFDLPTMNEDYVHRIGRTARNGAKGEAVSFVAPDECNVWRSLARQFKIPGVEIEGGEQSPSKFRRRPTGGRKRFNRSVGGGGGGARRQRRS